MPRRRYPIHSLMRSTRCRPDQAGTAPVLIRVATKAGHGAGKSISKIIDEYTDAWSFAAYNLAMDVQVK